MTATPRPPRYRFGEFVLSPSRRTLLRSGREVRLIPRYFDLLVLLLSRRTEAVQRREILERVWRDVVVSDGALSQAVRTLRRTLGDDSREPRYIRTLSRHGYRFVYPEVVEEADEGPLARATNGPRTWPAAAEDPFTAPLEVLLGRPRAGDEDDEAACRAAAERLHELGVDDALARLGRRPRHPAARAWLREVRWEVADAARVPILGQPGSLATAAILVRMRIRRVVRLAGRRWAAATAGGGLAGVVAGLLGGAALLVGPGSRATTSVLVALPLVGLVIGTAGAAGVAAGLCAAESLTRSFRGPALTLLGALGGGAVATIAHQVGAATLQELFGRDLSPVAGGLEGLVVGGAVGLGYALATAGSQGLATPRGARRLRVASAAALVCAVATTALTLRGSYLGAMSLDLLAHSFPGSGVGLEPLARLLGEARPGPVTRTAIGAWEGLTFGFGLVGGLTHRPGRHKRGG